MLADADGDGDSDVAVAFQPAGEVLIFAQTAPGIFGAAPAVTVQVVLTNTSIALALGDVDGDLDLDVVAALEGANRVVVHRQVAPGAFEPDPSTILAPGTSVLQGPLAVLVRDVDGDGDAEIVTANGSAGGSSDNLTIFSANAP